MALYCNFGRMDAKGKLRPGSAKPTSEEYLIVLDHFAKEGES